MLTKYVNKTEAELKALAETWENIERVSKWQSKERKTAEDINEFYMTMPLGYVADLDRRAKMYAPEYLKGINAKGLKVLDFGCGTGEYGLRLAEQGADVDFYDLSTPAVEFLKWRIDQRGLNCKVTNNISELAQKYDIIICVDVLEHLPNAGEVFMMLHNKLAKYGTMIFDTPLVLPITVQNVPNIIDNEHIAEAVENWEKRKVNHFIVNNYVINGYQYVKTDWNIMLLYNYSEGTTGDFIERALRKYARVITNRDFQCGANGEGIREVVKHRGINLLLQVDSGGWIKIPRNLPCLTACYSIDTFTAPEKIKKDILYPYDIKMYAQKRFAVDKNEYWVPLGVDTDTYKPKTVRLKHNIAFCGTFLVRRSQAKRNDCLKALVEEHYKKGVRFYLGRDYNEYASLRYSESELVFNMGIMDYPSGADVNMRFFEAMATGTPQICNKMDGAEELGFKAGVHYFEYTDKSDVVKVMYQALNNPQKRKEVSSAAYATVINGHTYVHRIKQMLNIFDEKRKN